MRSLLYSARRTIRLGRFLYAQRVKGLSPPEGDPFLDPEALCRFKEELAKASVYLEYGSGGSTVLADRAGIRGISVESDRYYAEVVRSRLRNDCMKIVTPDVGLTGEWGTPIFNSLGKGLRYVDAPFFMSPFPDFILVDGRYRLACALESARQAYLARKVATLMLDDYTTRSHYGPVAQHLGSPKLAGRAALFTIGELFIDRGVVVDAAHDKR